MLELCHDASASAPGLVSSSPPRCSRARRVVRRVSGAFAVALCVLCACQKDKDGRLLASGTIEAIEVRVSTTVGGLVEDVMIREGEPVVKGQVLMHFDATDIDLQADQARAAVRAASAQLKMARQGARPEDIESAQELLKQAEAGSAMAKADLERAEQLQSEGALTGKQLEDARTRHEVMASQKRAAALQYRKVLRGARPEELEMAEAQLAQADAALALGEKKIADCEIRAPRDGVIIHRMVEPGEVAGPGSTLFVLQDLSIVRLTVFVPETDVGRVRLGASVSVSIDSHPGRAFPGRVARVHSQAEFTPRNVQTRDERVKLVFGVEIELENRDGFLKPGLPADAVISEDGAVVRSSGLDGRQRQNQRRADRAEERRGGEAAPGGADMESPGASVAGSMGADVGGAGGDNKPAVESGEASGGGQTAGGGEATE